MIFLLSIFLGSLLPQHFSPNEIDTIPVVRKKIIMGEVGRTTFRDDYLSPNAYQLPTFGAIMKWEKSTPQCLVSKVFTVRVAVPQMPYYLRIWSNEGNFYYSRLYKITQSEHNKCYLGGFGNAIFATRTSNIYALSYGNNELSLDAGVNLGFCVFFQKKIKIFGGLLQFQDVFRSSVLSVLGRSGYAHGIYFKQNFWDNIKYYIYAGSVNEFLSINNGVNFDFTPKQKSTIKHPLRLVRWRLGINWYFKRYNEPSAFILSNTSVGIGRIIEF